MERSNDNLYPLNNFRNDIPVDSETNESSISHSGNSDVDVSIHVDTAPIGYAMLCSMLATKQLSNHEFDAAVRKLEDLTNNKKSHSNSHFIREKNDTTKAKLYHKRPGVQ